MAVRLSALRTRRTLHPRNIIIFMFLVLISDRGWVNPRVQPEGLGKFKNSPHRVSNPRPSGLKHNALTTTLPRAPYTWGFTVQMSNIYSRVHTLYLRPLSVGAHYSNLCPTNSSSRCHGSPRHLNGRTRDRVRFRFVQYCEHFYFHDFKW
jgi:hypothetical protein